MSEIQLNLVTRQDYDAWLAEWTRSVAPPEDPEGSMIPDGATFLDIEEITNQRSLPPHIPIDFSPAASFRDVQREMKARIRQWLLELPFSQLVPALTVATIRTFLPFPIFEFYSPSVPDAENNAHQSLDSLGFSSSDIVVVGYAPLPLAMVGSVPDTTHQARHSVRDLAHFFSSVIATYPPSVSGKEALGPCLTSLLLYTEEDTDLACYVRQYYPYLHGMTGYYLNLYVFEHLPPAPGFERQENRRFWQDILPADWLPTWATLGLTKSKPYPKQEMYDLARQLGIPPDRLPCVLVFREWNDVVLNPIVIDVSPPLPYFFRGFCTEIMNTVELQRRGADLDDFLASFAFDEFADVLRERFALRNRVVAARWRPKQFGVTMPKVFFCHSSADKDFVERLALELRALGLGVWLDKWEMLVGDSIVERIEEAVEDSDFVCVILSPDSVRSDWVRRELDAAYVRELEERRVIVLPILYRPCTIPGLLRAKLYADFSKSYEEGFASLIRRLAPELKA